MRHSEAFDRLPKSIRVCGFTIAIKSMTVDKSFSEGNYAHFSSICEEITVREWMQSAQKLVDSLIHELNHAVFYYYGIGNDDNEERIVSTLGKAWTQIFSDNPGLATWIESALHPRCRLCGVKSVQECRNINCDGAGFSQKGRIEMSDMIWMQALEGGAFDLLHPTPEMVNWHTVSVVLARIGRFGGHTLQGTYSVAQHSVEGARAILRDTGRRDWARAFLLHDVHEAYIGDIMTPVAKAIEALAVEEAEDELAAGYVNRAMKALKHRIDRAVYEKAGVPFPLHPECAKIVKDYDYRMAITERNARLAPYSMPWHHTIESRKPIEGCDMTPWSEALAAVLFRSALSEFGIGATEKTIPAPSNDACGCDDCLPLDDIIMQGWPDSPAPYRKKIEPIWR